MKIFLNLLYLKKILKARWNYLDCFNLRNPIFVISFSLMSVNCFPQKLNITIDERIETLYSVAYLSDYFLVNKHDNIFKQRLNEICKPLKNHKAVHLLDSLSANYSFNYYRPIEWVLSFSQFSEFKKINDKDSISAGFNSEKRRLLSELKNELLNFHKDSLYQKYLSSVENYKAIVLSALNSSKSIKQLPGYLKEYYGKSLMSYNLIVSPFVHSGGFNIEIQNTNQNKEVYAVIGPNGEVDFIPYFDKDYLEYDMILHEFGHSFVNPLLDKYSEDIEQLSQQYYTDNLKYAGKQQGYSKWKYVFNELLVRATTICIVKKYISLEKAEELLMYEKSIGFGLVELFVMYLEDYENNRNQYKTFDDYYHKLIQKLKST